MRQQVIQTVLAILVTAFLSAPAQADRTRALLAPLHGTPAPDFTLNDLDGAPVSLKDFRGKVLVVNFWATWCPPCRVEMPSMQRAWAAFQNEGIIFLGIDIGESEDRVVQFMADLGLDFPVLLDTESTVTNAWPVKGLPTTVVVDPQGRMVYRAIGAREWDDEGIVKQLRALKKK